MNWITSVVPDYTLKGTCISIMSNYSNIFNLSAILVKKKKKHTSNDALEAVMNTSLSNPIQMGYSSIVHQFDFQVN